MTNPIPAPSVAFTSCIDEVLKQSPFLIDRWTAKLADAMHERSISVADSWERHQLQDAISVLRKYRISIEQGFPERLEKAIAADGLTKSSGKKAVSSGRLLSSVSFDDLELMGEHQVQQAVENARMLQLVKLGCEAGLASFSARMSTAQGLRAVKNDSNPLRPEIMALVLIELLQSLPMSAQTRAYWLLDGSRIMGEELQSLYVWLNDFLAAQGVASAVYEVMGASQAGTSGGWPPRKLVAAAPDTLFPEQLDIPKQESADENTAAPVARKPMLTLDHLHHLLVGDYDVSDHEPTSFSEFGVEELTQQDFAHTVPAALDALTELEEMGLVSAKTKLTRPLPPTPVADLRAQLKTDAKTLGQSLAIEVVGLMIEQMANDERLLTPVRRMIANAEPAFLRLAVTDPRFFSDKSHPARKLLEAITRASLGYASENAAGFPEFLQHLRELAVLLADEQVCDSENFARLLKDFERRQGRNNPANRKVQRLAVQTLLQAEQRNLMAVKIAAEIRARPDFINDNRIITAFLTGPWSQVLAQERLSVQGKTPGSVPLTFSLTLDDVLWSLNVEQVTRHRKRLLTLIPKLLDSLKQGLLSIDFPVDQSQPFFDELILVHRAALKPVPDMPAQQEKASQSLGKMFVENSGLMPLWLAPSEVQDSGFMDDQDDPIPSLPTVSLQESEVSGFGSPIDVNAKIALELGDWVDLLVDMQWLRAELTWVSPLGTLFMFTSQGGRKHSMTSRVLRKLLSLNLVKIVSQQGMVEGALDSVARTAMQNSVLNKGSA
ncbi:MULTISPECIES: DUF1631 family protein [unclassified Polaromonas]|uniref:DUF1631 family protein n=1 Tax=unclassified Polaromonas TaxID=2638319 RepID=UPI0018CBB4CD|nr:MULTISPECIES: DUF1631 family protein [unclassified Polaromonas]